MIIGDKERLLEEMYDVTLEQFSVSGPRLVRTHIQCWTLSLAVLLFPKHPPGYYAGSGTRGSSSLLVLGKPQARVYATKTDISKIHSLNLIEIQEAVCLLLAAAQFG